MALQTRDPRIAELLELEAHEGMSLAVRPETICALEDIGWLIHPFTGELWRDPNAGAYCLADLVTAADLTLPAGVTWTMGEVTP